MWRTWTNPSSSWVYGGVRSPFRPGCVAQRGRRCHRGRALPRAESGSLWLRSLWGAGGLRAGDLCEELAGGRPAEPTSCSLPREGRSLWGPRRSLRGGRSPRDLGPPPGGRAVGAGPRFSPVRGGGGRLGRGFPRCWRPPAAGGAPEGAGAAAPWGAVWRGQALVGAVCAPGAEAFLLSLTALLLWRWMIHTCIIYYKQHSPRKSCWSTLVVQVQFSSCMIWHACAPQCYIWKAVVVFLVPYCFA